VVLFKAQVGLNSIPYNNQGGGALLHKFADYYCVDDQSVCDPLPEEEFGLEQRGYSIEWSACLDSWLRENR
jgi:hypothetical protein